MLSRVPDTWEVESLYFRTIQVKNPRSHINIMFDPKSFVNPTPLAHADTSRDVLPRGGTSQLEKKLERDRMDCEARVPRYWLKGY
ncbi:hypothetical protein TNCV_2663571 [Trichonephila clavipes]|nr:hypothetical protein TNCV_2663571 [Trichonephila clavipes]